MAHLWWKYNIAIYCPYWTIWHLHALILTCVINAWRLINQLVNYVIFSTWSQIAKVAFNTLKFVAYFEKILSAFKKWLSKSFERCCDVLTYMHVRRLFIFRAINQVLRCQFLSCYTGGNRQVYKVYAYLVSSLTCNYSAFNKNIAPT